MKKKLHSLSKKTCLLLFLIGITWHAQSQITLTRGIPCSGDSTGELGVIPPTFGTGPYTYAWNTGKTSPSISGLKAGNYSVTITDNLGATQSFNHRLDNPSAIVTSPVIVNNSSWPFNNGQIDVHGNGGTGWLKYSLFDSTARVIRESTNGIYTSLGSGTYYLRTYDINQCSKYDSLRIKELASMAIDSAVDYTACYKTTAPISVKPKSNKVPIVVNFGDSVRTIVKVIGGARPYILSNKDTVDAIGYDAWPGFHVVVVSDAIGNGARFAWTVDSVSAPLTLSWVKKDIKCHGGKNGSIDITANGSYPRYRYQWNGPDAFSSTDPSITKLVAGIYQLRVEDINIKDDSHCTLEQTIEITEPNQPVQVTIGKKDNTCHLSNDASLKADGSGGTGSLHFSWSPGAQTTNEIKNLAVGTYTVTVRDSNNCTATAFETIIQPNRLKTRNVSFDTLSCYNYSNATISFASGANRILWKKDGMDIGYSNRTSATNLAAGTYDIHLDSVMCPFDTSFVIVNPVRPNYKYIIDSIGCNDKPGSVSVSTGVGGLFFSYLTTTKTGAVGDTIRFGQLKAQTHTFRVSVGGCSWDSAIVLVQPLPLSVNITTTDNLCFGDSIGTLTGMIQGGTSGAETNVTVIGPRKTWVFLTPSNTFSLSNLPKGTYKIELVDNKQCRTNQSIIIDSPNEKNRIVLEQTNRSDCDLLFTNSVQIREVQGGLAPYLYTWSNGKTTQQVDSLEAGKIKVHVVDANGCIAEDSTVLVSNDGECYNNAVSINGDNINANIDLSALCKDGVILTGSIFHPASGKKFLFSNQTPIWVPDSNWKFPSGPPSAVWLHFTLSKNNKVIATRSEWITVVVK